MSDLDRVRDVVEASKRVERDGECWLTVKEYADLHRVHVQTVYTAIRYQRLDERVKRVGRAIRIVVSRASINRLTPS